MIIIVNIMIMIIVMIMTVTMITIHRASQAARRSHGPSPLWAPLWGIALLTFQQPLAQRIISLIS